MQGKKTILEYKRESQQQFIEEFEITKIEVKKLDLLIDQIKECRIVFREKYFRLIGITSAIAIPVWSGIIKVILEMYKGSMSDKIILSLLLIAISVILISILNIIGILVFRKYECIRELEILLRNIYSGKISTAEEK